MELLRSIGRQPGPSRVLQRVEPGLVRLEPVLLADVNRASRRRESDSGGDGHQLHSRRVQLPLRRGGG